MRQAIARLKTRLDVPSNPYLRALADGGMTRGHFVETQIQFFAAVAGFSRAMATLAERTSDEDHRKALLENIRDEQGAGDPSRSHEATFMTLLRRLGCSAEDVASRAQWPEVRAFNGVVWATCALDDEETALAMLGMIEDLFSDIAGRIGRGIVARGWLPATDVIHYPTHEAIDVAHAEAFYRCVEARYPRDPRHAYRVDQGLELGGHIFLRLYEDLYRARDRCTLRNVDGPHNGVDGWVPGALG